MGGEDECRRGTEEQLVHVIGVVVRGDIDVKDDVLLDKLLGHVHRQLAAGTLQLLYDKDAFAKLVEDLTVPKLDVTCKAFGLRLVGVLLKSAQEQFVGDALEHLANVVRDWIETCSSPEASLVTVAGLDMLVMWSGSNVLLEKIVTKELINAVVNCLQSRNVYVSAGAQKFLTQVIGKAYGEGKQLTFPRVHVIAKELGAYLLRKLIQKDDDDDSHWTKIVRLILPILKSICEDNPDFVHLLDMQTMLNILSACRDKQVTAFAIGILSVIVCSRLPAEENVCDAIQELKNYDEIYVVEFASYLLAKSSELSEPTQLMLQSILLQSLDLRNKSLLKSVEIIKKCCGYIKRTDFQDQSLSRLCHLLTEMLPANQFGARAKTIVTVLESLPFMLNQWTVDVCRHRTILELHISILENQATSSAVVIKTMKNIQHLLDIYAKSVPSMLTDLTQTWDRLSASLSKYLTHLDWDVRDSTLEVITHLAKVAATFPSLGTMSLVNHKLPLAVWEQLVFEDESYVRASAFAAVAAFSAVPVVWDRLTHVHSQGTIVKHVVHFASEDPEAIVRRAAYKLLATFFFNSDFSDYMQAFLRAFSKATTDSDWEVKAGAVAVWKTVYLKMLQQLHVDHEADSETVHLDKDGVLSLLKELDARGWCAALSLAVEDCDVSVRSKAASLLLGFKKLLRKVELLPTDAPRSETGLGKDDAERMEDTSREHTEDGTDYDVRPFDSSVADEVLATADKLTVESMMQKDDVDVDSAYKALMGTEIRTVSADEFMAKLARLDLEAIVNSVQGSPDLHEDNVHSLLEDLLLSLPSRKNNALDCY